jgi:putative mycofactocin binding protein MftB
MASAECTEPGSGPRYFVSSSARVRLEHFGLLFYDTRSAKLTYVKSGESLTPRGVDSAGARELAVAELDAPRKKVIARLLEGLQAKGLIVAVESADQ